jgi:hypothetical protein
MCDTGRFKGLIVRALPDISNNVGSVKLFIRALLQWSSIVGTTRTDKS